MRLLTVLTEGVPEVTTICIMFAEAKRCLQNELSEIVAANMQAIWEAEASAVNYDMKLK